MGVTTRRPLLPAPTESIVDSFGSSVTGTDLGTDISRRTDKTSYSIPDDGSPVTIPTRRKHRSRGEDSTKLSRSSHHSQTSLLIEYFEGGKGSGGSGGAIVSRPSVRVRVTPSSGKKSKEPSVHITDSAGNRRPSFSRRISLGSPSKSKSGGDDLSYSSSADENQTPGPVEIELLNRDQGSELSTLSRDRRYLPTSDISSMPADSMLEAPSSGPRQKHSQSPELEESDPKDYLKTPTRQRSRSLSTERIAQRAAEKVSNYSRDASSKRRAGKSRGIATDYQEVEAKSPRHRGYTKEDDMASPESSLLSASAVSSHRRSGDQYSFRSNTSKSSLNNPKLLETVEDAIRRLILPELKELKKDQKVMTNTSKFERDISSSYSPASSESRDGLVRRLSKHSSAPNVRKPKVILNRDSRDEGIVLADDSVSSRKERRASRDSTMTSESGYVKGFRPELSEQDMVRRQKSKGLRDAEKAGIVGSRLTANNLKHHDSNSSLGKFKSPTDSEPKNINETELVFQKHNVAPMPFRSALESEMTRASILSDQTAEPEYRDSRYDLGLKHSNMSSHNLSMHSVSDHGREWSHSPSAEAAGAIAAAAAANLLDTHSDSRELNYSSRRGLSPIQSVASNQSESHVRRGSTQHVPQEYSGDEREMEPKLSIESLSSAPSTNLARSKREGITAESQDEISRYQSQTGPDLGYEGSSVLSSQTLKDKPWQEESENGAYRHSLTETASIDHKHMTNYADGSESDFIEKANQGRPVAEGAAVNPRFIHPAAVESAVASVLDPSILDTKSNQSGGSHSQSNTYVQGDNGSTRSFGQLNQSSPTSRQGSPLKQQHNVSSSPDATSFPRRMGVTSPPQSVTQSLDDLTEPVELHPDDHGDSFLPQDRELSPETESEINTNPSIIQGPAAGVGHDSTWPYNTTPGKGGHSPLLDNVATAAAAGAGLGLASSRQDYGHDYYPEDDYADAYQDQQYANEPVFGTPPGAKDEGYVSAANPISPSPQPGTKGFDGIDTNGLGLFDSPGDDPFEPAHQRHFSGYSHGVGSPLYDSATGRGIERIQSKDIVALMDHLTVRDAQRNARDTEILVTLVRSAAEMRNSFEEMKKFIAQQDGMLLDLNERQHERTYKAIGGPRPLPGSGSRTRQPSVDDGEDSPAKRKNLFKRALKGLSLKSGNDLSRIEDMLEQLLDDMEALRSSQNDMMRSRGPASADLDGYEPEGLAGTSSQGDNSGFLSNSSRAVPEPRGAVLRRDTENRVSTVQEADEDELDERGEFLSPQLPLQENVEPQRERAGSAPVSTPPRGAVASGALSNSNETTPKANDKARKHKSSSSSFFPKISRWSRTTASSMGDNIRNSMQPGRKERVSFDTSRSGSDLAHGPYKATDYYDPQGDDRLRSNYTLNDEGSPQQENRPPSPLVPSQVSEAPKYRAHRDSLDMQHPQPRQGPTGRYQSQLESQAQIYGVSGNHSGQWGSNPSFSVLNGNRRSSGGSRLSPISDAGYSEASGRSSRQGPPRPPKIKDEGPLFPERPPKIKEGEEQSYADRVVSRSSAMQSPGRSTPPARKPTGPRPLNSNSQYNSPSRRRRNYRDSPEHVDDEHDY
ncbi:hypothetical protein BDW74DRAFT_145820 [Aspergillus multicolor]|uniref:uncharacterized protein n=1 Tax=Aspergillus multicolor TaxID=41759 RepID=UPI003CCDE573